VTTFSGYLRYGTLTVLLILLSAGCASKPKVDWNSRIGSFTYDQAVLELGPPASHARLEDGTTVAEWLLSHGSQFSFGVGTGFYGPSAGVGVGQSVTTTPPGNYLRLVFGPDGILKQWEKVKR
jgi:hypothetical protein